MKRRGHILIVEDEILTGFDLAGLLALLGFEPIGPIASVGQALATARSAALDAALLDINLSGETIYPVARELDRRGIPFVFVSGFQADDPFAGRPLVQKPFQPNQVRRAIEHALAAGP